MYLNKWALKNCARFLNSMYLKEYPFTTYYQNLSHNKYFIRINICTTGIISQKSHLWATFNLSEQHSTFAQSPMHSLCFWYVCSTAVVLMLLHRHHIQPVCKQRCRRRLLICCSEFVISAFNREISAVDLSSCATSRVGGDRLLTDITNNGGKIIHMPFTSMNQVIIISNQPLYIL